MADKQRCGKVLVVEDEWLIAATLEDTLTALGYEVLGPAPTVEGALRLLESEKPGFALLDISLGREKSFPIAERLNQEGVPFVFLTGYVSSDLPPSLAQAPMIAKPVCESDLLAALAKMVTS
jgi:DNA-binding response OmpR family regulator